MNDPPESLCENITFWICMCPLCYFCKTRAKYGHCCTICGTLYIVLTKVRIFTDVTDMYANFDWLALVGTGFRFSFSQ